MLQWQAIMEAEKEKCSSLTVKDKFAYFLLLQYRNPYGWGRENLVTADCSGSVCLALMLATGCMVRTTANGLLEKFFTKKKPTSQDIQCAFFVCRNDRKHGDRIAKRGQAVHVVGSVGNGVVFNSVMPVAELRTLEGLKREYDVGGCDCVVRGLNMEALEEAHKNCTDLFGLDDEVERYFG